MIPARRRNCDFAKETSSTPWHRKGLPSVQRMPTRGTSVKSPSGLTPQVLCRLNRLPVETRDATAGSWLHQGILQRVRPGSFFDL